MSFVGVSVEFRYLGPSYCFCLGIAEFPCSHVVPLVVHLPVTPGLSSSVLSSAFLLCFLKTEKGKKSSYLYAINTDTISSLCR